MADVKFSDFTAIVKGEFDKKAVTFLEEAVIEVTAETQRTTPTTEPQLKGSWDWKVDESKMEATVGSPLESSLWNEFGTGSYAEKGDGRKGWWVYVDGQGKSAHVSKTYQNQVEAEKGAAFLRSKGLDAHPSNGKAPQKTLRNAFAKKKQAIINRARQIFGGDE